MNSLDNLVEVRYVDAITGKAGSTRMRFFQVPAWLEASPGTLILSIREV